MTQRRVEQRSEGKEFSDPRELELELNVEKVKDLDPQLEGRTAERCSMGCG